MGAVKQSPGSIRSVLGIHVRVFYSLALICALEVLLWSFCLFAAHSSGAAQAYYTRETGNLKSTTGQTVRVPPPAIDPRGVELALKAESAWHQRALASLYAATRSEPPASVGRSLSAQTRALLEEFRDTGGEGASEGPANVVIRA